MDVKWEGDPPLLLQHPRQSDIISHLKMHMCLLLMGHLGAPIDAPCVWLNNLYRQGKPLSSKQ